MGERWRGGHQRREAVLNMGAPGSRLRLVAYLGVLCGLAVVAQALVSGAQHAADLRRRVDAGHGVLTYQAVDPQRVTRISRASCEALRSDPRVDRAGALTHGRLASLPQLGRDQRVIAATPGLIPELGQHRGLLGAALPNVSGTLVVDGAAVEVGRLTRQPRGVDVNSSVVLPAPADLTWVDQCTVVLRVPVGIAEAAPELAARLEVQGGPVAPAGPGLRADDLAARFLARPDRWSAHALGLVAGLLAGAVNRLRSGELVVYRLSGTSRADLARLLLVEQAHVAGVVVAVTSLSVCALAGSLVSPAATLWGGATCALTWMLVAAVGSMPEVVRNPLAPVTSA